MSKRDGGPCHGSARKLDVGGLAMKARSELNRLGWLINRREAAARRGAEVLFHRAASDVGGNVAGDDDDEVVGRVAFAIVGEKLVAGDRRKHVAMADHRLAQRMSLEHRARKGIPMATVVIVVAHRDLAQDDVAFAGHLVGRQSAAQHHVGEQIDRDVHVRRGKIDVVDGAVVSGVGVDLPAMRLHGGGNLAAGAALGALEQQVLQIVRQTCAKERPFVLAAGFNPNLNGNNGRGVIRLHEQHETVFQLGAMNRLGPEALEESTIGGSEQRSHYDSR